MGDLTGVRVVVTGATSGLGAAMADALLSAGATVAFASRPTARLDANVVQRRAKGLDAVSLPMDVRDPVSVQVAAHRAFEILGGIDVVVNNAGIGMGTVNPRFLEMAMPFYEVTADGFRDMVATNLTGYFLVARAFTPLFLEQGRGRFVNVTANHETMRRKGFVPYGPARAGAEALSLIMVEDLRPYGITVNLLLPGGATDTGIIPGEVSPAIRKNLLQPGVMGAPIVFLASSEAEGLTGERIVAKDFENWHTVFRRRSTDPMT